MNIGILTFHWACNYGAVLQTYALKEAFESLGAKVQIIDYYPKKYKKNLFNAIKTRHFKLIKKRISDIKKDRNIESFRKKAFLRTRYFKSSQELKKQIPECDCFVCGSDQVWNMSFIEHGEKKNTFVYFLDFVPESRIKASYAASFGTLQCKENLKVGIANNLKTFDFISVREESGKKIVNGLGDFNCKVVPDPTILLKGENYLKFVRHLSSEKKYAFVYMLHGKDSDAIPLKNEAVKNGFEIVNSSIGGVEEWLGNIKNSEFVITNSFHGMVFSILFEKPFAALLIDGSGMNDRILTLLQKIGLEDRIFQGDLTILEKSINWVNVREKLEEYRKVGYDYLLEILNYKKMKADKNEN